MFALPNFIDRTVVGTGGSFRLGQQVGSTTVTLSEGNLPAHNHTVEGTVGGNHPAACIGLDAYGRTWGSDHDASPRRVTAPIELRVR